MGAGRLAPDWPIQLGIFCLTLAVYWNTLQAGFAFDDNFALIRNGDVTDPNRSVWELFKNDFWGQEIKGDMSHKSYRPLTVLAFRLTYLLQKKLGIEPEASGSRTEDPMAPEQQDTGGLAPSIFHATNVLLHGCVTLAMYRLALRLVQLRDAEMCLSQSQAAEQLHQGGSYDRNTERERAESSQTQGSPPLKEGNGVGRETRPRQQRGVGDFPSDPRGGNDAAGHGHWEAALAATLFGLHPVHTEAVAGIVGQAELLSALLSISALLWYLHAINNGPASQPLVHGGRWAAACVAVALALIAALCKEIGITALGSMLVADFFLSPACAHGPPAGGKNVVQNRMRRALRRALLLAFVGVMYVKARSWVAGDHIVRIYRKVENPIPFADSWLTRVLTTGYIQAKYAQLLLWPSPLSADWSFACIPYVETLSDPRNLCTLALYFALAAVAVDARPWKMLLELTGTEAPPSDASLVRSKYRCCLLYGLVVCPFFPASNVLFYVGTLVAERLLYFPSVGFCLLLAHIVVGPTKRLLKGKSRLSRSGDSLSKGAAVVAVLALYATHTVQRNRDWESEETLFISAQQVCLDSAKVRLNSGILERRRMNWTAALEHFNRAREIEPGYCDPKYWIGITLVNSGRVHDGARALEDALSCKYVAANALESLNKVYAAMLKLQPNNPALFQAWGRILVKDEVGRVGIGCTTLEQAALEFAGKPGNEQLAAAAMDACIGALKRKSLGLGNGGQQIIKDNETLTGPEIAMMLKCVEARRAVVVAIAQHGAAARPAELVAMGYLQDHAEACRAKRPGGDDASVQQKPHALLVHKFQSEHVYNPWLHLEWGEVLVLEGRAAEAGKHFDVAGLILLNHLSSAAKGGLQGTKNDRSVLPADETVTDAEGNPLAREEMEAIAASAFERALEVGHEDVCLLGVRICEVRVQGAALRGVGRDWRADEGISSCLEWLRERRQCGEHYRSVRQTLDAGT
eukprot:evm.model.scf_344.3 EVM.evm.TU.scf_344.3   scf_344:28738-43688(+)